MRVPLMKEVAWYLVFAMFIIGIAPKVEAGFAPSEMLALANIDRAADMGKIQKVLEMKIVQDRLSQLGYSAEEISGRLAQLSDEQVHQLALQIDDLKVGGDGLGIIIALLVIVILVVILIQLSGRRVVITR